MLGRQSPVRVDRQGAESREPTAAICDALLSCWLLLATGRCHRGAALQSAAASALPDADAPLLAWDRVHEVLNKQRREQRWPLGLFLMASWAAHPWASGPIRQ
jgi:hypothetical protein